MDKRYGNRGRWQGYVLFSTPLVAKFTESTGAVGGASYSFFDWLGVGISGGIFGSSEVDVVEQVRLSRAGEPVDGAPLSDLFRLVWFAGGEVTFTPLYGRISFASEYSPAFDLFLVLGGGVAGTERDLGSPTAANDELATVDEITGYFSFGVGLRFHVLSWLAARTEYRHLLLLEPEIPATEVEDPTTDVAGTLTNVQQFQVGLQFTY
ncbi:MAG: outer membrane beta-barrel domain-containing protein [Myxococcota bacterium]